MPEMSLSELLRKVLQVSFTFSDPRGIRPKGICTWRWGVGEFLPLLLLSDK